MIIAAKIYTRENFVLKEDSSNPRNIEPSNFFTHTVLYYLMTGHVIWLVMASLKTSCLFPTRQEALALQELCAQTCTAHYRSVGLPLPLTPLSLPLHTSFLPPHPSIAVLLSSLRFPLSALSLPAATSGLSAAVCLQLHLDRAHLMAQLLPPSVDGLTSPSNS